MMTSITPALGSANTISISAASAPALQAGEMTAGEMTALLEETIAALTKLDTARLEEMVTAVEAKIGTGELEAMLLPDRAMWEQELSRITARHRLLGRVLDNTGVNLRVLEGLNRRARIGEQTWAR